METEMERPEHGEYFADGFGKCEVRCIDVIRTLPFSLGSAVKHVWAASEKDWKSHLETAKWYIADLQDNRFEYKASPAATAVWDLVTVCFDTERREVYCKWKVIEALLLFQLDKALAGTRELEKIYRRMGKAAG